MPGWLAGAGKTYIPQRRRDAEKKLNGVIIVFSASPRLRVSAVISIYSNFTETIFDTPGSCIVTP
jgi:hypothetical protein